MQANERRFRERYDASPLKLELRNINWLGRATSPYPASACNFALGGIAVITTQKLKPGKRLLLNLAMTTIACNLYPPLCCVVI